MMPEVGPRLDKSLRWGGGGAGRVTGSGGGASDDSLPRRLPLCSGCTAVRDAPIGRGRRG